MYFLGFVAKEDRVFLIDKAYNVVSYKVLLSVLNYQTSVVRKDFVTANSILPSIPKSEHGAVARFLESQGYKEEALAVSTDPDHRFELAVDLRKMDIAHTVLVESGTMDEGSTDYQSKWRRLGDLALANGDVSLAKGCASRSGDLSGLLLLHSSAGDMEGMKALALQAKEAGRSNVAFIAFFVTGQVEHCIQLLIDTGRIPEAAFMARTYMPSMISGVLEMWKTDLKQINEKAAEALADPQKYPNLFPDLEWALKVEDMYNQRRGIHVPAISYPTAKGELELNLLEMVKNQSMNEEAELFPTPPQTFEVENPSLPTPPTPPTAPMVDLEEERLAAEEAALRIQQEQERLIAEASANSLAVEAMMEKERLEEQEREEQAAMIAAKESEIAMLELQRAEAAMVAARVEQERLENEAEQLAQMERAAAAAAAVKAQLAAVEAQRAADAAAAAAAAAQEEEEEEELGNLCGN
jgi:coatomer subunit beta'